MMEKSAMRMTFENATTRSVDVNGTNFAFREIGKKGGVPVVFLHHLTAVLEDWDPRVVDGLAATHHSSLCSIIVGSADPAVLPPKRSRRWLGMPSRSSALSVLAKSICWASRS